MTAPRIVSREQWNTERAAFLVKEKEFTRAKDRLNAQRRQLPMVEIDKEYLFTGTEGKASLLDLFAGQQQLIVYHFMFAPEWEQGCPACSYLVDHLEHPEHLRAAGTSWVATSRAPMEKITAFKTRMGWTFPWYSASEEFVRDFAALVDLPDGPADRPGISVFSRIGERILHSYSTHDRGTENVVGTFAYLDLTPGGRAEEAGIMNWLRHHDSYDVTSSTR